MTFTETMAELKTLGKDRTAATYRRHGSCGEVFGVSFADLGKLAKKIKTDHALAVALWETDNYDARNLACMIADPKAATRSLVDQWVASCRHHGLIDVLVANYLVKTTAAKARAEVWCDAADELTGRAGWQLLAHLAMKDTALADEFFLQHLDTIQREIHTRPNRTREAMNSALIAIGVRSLALEKKALAVAAKIGKVEVDHGDTACKTPDAAAYIRKTLDYRKARKG